MSDPLSDDSSAASSGDEMLKMVVPFSQEAANSPGKSSGKGSDSEDEADSGKKQEPQDKAKLTGKKRQHEEIVVNSSMNSTEIGEKAQANASKAFNIAFHGCKIGAPDKLFWQETTKKNGRKRQKMIFPARVVTTEETVGLALGDWNDETHRPIQYIQYPHQQIKGGNGVTFAIASLRGLSPYYGKKGDDTNQWCPAKFEQYSKQLKGGLKGFKAIDIKTEESYLQCVLRKSLAEGEQEKKLAEVDEAVPEEISTAIEDKKEHIQSDSEEEDEEETGVPRMRTRRSTGMQESTDRLRAGDQIEFYKQQCVAGDPSGLCTATILRIDPKGDPILTIDEAFTTLQADLQVKRIKRYSRGKLLDHSGKYRSINKYDLVKGGDPDALKKLLARQNAQTKENIQQKKEQIRATLEKAGLGSTTDMLR
mmetsp:Transcript_20112/g.43666  ORF Transcript_20112/g.43666 Transcript_20112/m.43666 type:complete len:422 (-) Transcript_20112:48-1313(-)